MSAQPWIFLSNTGLARPVIVSGNSLGSAAAIFAAGELGHRVHGYILESPYQDLKVAVWNRTDVNLPPVLSHAAYTGLRVVAPLFLPHLDQISPLKAIRGIPQDVPVLIMAGDADRLARPAEAQAIFREVATHSKLVLFPGAGHGDLFGSDRDLYTRTVLESSIVVGFRTIALGLSDKRQLYVPKSRDAKAPLIFENASMPPILRPRLRFQAATEGMGISLLLGLMDVHSTRARIGLIRYSPISLRGLCWGWRHAGRAWQAWVPLGFCLLLDASRRDCLRISTTVCRG